MTRCIHRGRSERLPLYSFSASERIRRENNCERNNKQIEQVLAHIRFLLAALSKRREEPIKPSKNYVLCTSLCAEFRGLLVKLDTKDDSSMAQLTFCLSATMRGPHLRQPFDIQSSISTMRLWKPPRHQLGNEMYNVFSTSRRIFSYKTSSLCRG